MLDDETAGRRPWPGCSSSEGIYVVGFSFPVVPKGQARIRVQLSALHSADDIARALAGFEKVGRQMGILGRPTGA